MCPSRNTVRTFYLQKRTLTSHCSKNILEKYENIILCSMLFCLRRDIDVFYLKMRVFFVLF